MKKILFGLVCALTLGVEGLEYEKQFENEHICIAKVKISPYEEIGLHRDEKPQVVIALKGGTITRLEADGTETEVNFPTGESVFRKTDLEGELHRSVNRSSESIELIIIELKNQIPETEKEDTHDIAVDIKINCPMSDEFMGFVKSIPSPGVYSSSFEEWKSSFVANMTQLIRLVESEKILNSHWGVQVDDRLREQAVEN